MEKQTVKNRWILYALSTAAILALAAYGSRRAHFRWDVLGDQMRHVSWPLIVLGIGLIYAAYVIRAMRWSVFIREQKRVAPLSLVGTQAVGFTAVSLLGRIADPVRPYLVARKTGLSVSSQIAVYAVERMFDLASMSLIFSFGLLLAPDRASLPHPEIVRGVARASLLVTAVLIAFAIVARVGGDRVAARIEGKYGQTSPGFARSAAEKIRAFRAGLGSIARVGDLLAAAALSLLMWGMIACAYLSTVRAFVGSPPLAGMTFGRCVVLMAASMVSSVVPIPVLSWFVQIAAIAKTMQGFFNVAPEPALGAGAMLLLVTFMSIIPVGLVWSRFERVSLHKLAQESEHASGESGERRDDREPEFVPEA